MNCYECGTQTINRISTPLNPYQYDLSGLKDVRLYGITVRFCPTCRSETPVIPKITQLHELIADIITKSTDLLEGESLRFLRKYAGFPANKFSALLGISASHLSRVENGHTLKLSASADKLARALAMSARNAEYTRRILLSVADQRIQAKRANKKENPSKFRLVGGGWKAA